MPGLCQTVILILFDTDRALIETSARVDEAGKKTPRNQLTSCSLMNYITIGKSAEAKKCAQHIINGLIEKATTPFPSQIID